MQRDYKHYAKHEEMTENERVKNPFRTFFEKRII